VRAFRQPLLLLASLAEQGAACSATAAQAEFKAWRQTCRTARSAQRLRKLGHVVLPGCEVGLLVRPRRSTVGRSPADPVLIAWPHDRRVGEEREHDLRPPQGHCSTSSRKTRWRSSLQGMRVCRPELGRSAQCSPAIRRACWTGAGWQAAAPDSGGRGTISGTPGGSWAEDTVVAHEVMAGRAAPASPSGGAAPSAAGRGPRGRRRGDA